MEVQTAVNGEPELVIVPSILIDTLHSNVPLDDRMDADSAFDQPFLTSLKDGMSWYLTKRGLKIVEQGANLRLTGVITDYEGWRGWGHWGVDVRLKLTFFRGDQAVVTETIRSFLKYSDDEDVEDQEKPKYSARGLDISFPQILFTRVGIDLCEKIILLVKERAVDLHAPPMRPTGSVSTGHGRITLEATVENAEVLIDGMLVGTTPLKDLVLPSVLHTVEIRKAGFEPWKREVAILDGAHSRIVAELEPAKSEPR